MIQWFPTRSRLRQWLLRRRWARISHDTSLMNVLS